MELVCRRRSNCQKEPWFGKSSGFVCLIGIFSRKLLWCHKKQRTTLHMFGSSYRSSSSCLTNQWPWFRSRHQRCSIKKGVLKNFPKFIVKQLRHSLFLNKVVGLSLQLYSKRDSDTGVFLWILRNFKEHFRVDASVDFPKSVSLHWNGFFYGHMLSSVVSVILTSIFTGFKSWWPMHLLWRHWRQQSNLNLFAETEELHNFNPNIIEKTLNPSILGISQIVPNGEKLNNTYSNITAIGW